MRGALIGCGFFAQNHLHAWRDMRADGAELTAICDVDEGKARASAEKFAVDKVYADAATMFEKEKLDFVDIVTRKDSHRDLVALAAAHGVNVIVQKPLAPIWTDALAIVAAARKAGVRLAVHENFRFQAPMTKIRAALARGEIGRPIAGHISFRTNFDVYRTQPYLHEERRLAVLDVGVHVLDLARVFFGEVRHLSCETQRRNAKNIGEDTAVMMLRHDSGAVSVVECTYESRLRPDPFPETLVTIEGESGSLDLGPGFKAQIARGDTAQEYDFGSDLLTWTERPWHIVQESVLRTQQSIIAAWRAGREAETNGDDNLKTFALVEAAYEAAQSARAVEPLRAQWD